MNYKKYYYLFFIVLIIVLIILCYIHFSTKNNIESFSSNENTNINPTLYSKEEFTKNLIQNGNFFKGDNIKNNINQSGHNKIIKMKNPGKSSYVLEQKRTNDLTFYELLVNSVPNSRYMLLLWVSFNENIENVDLLSIIRVRVRNKDYSNNILNMTYDIVQKVEIGENKWYLLQYNFKVDLESLDKMNIYLNYSDKFTYDYIYFTDLTLYRILIDAESFIYNDGLNCYLDSYQYESNTLTWHDLSGNGNDFFWSNIPTTDYTKGFLNMNNLFLKGPISSTLLNNNKFTIVIVINREIENKVVKDEDGEQYKYLLTVPGNERNSFEISIDKENHINYHGDRNTIYRTENPVILYNKSVLTFTYENSKFSLYQDSIQLLSRQVGKFYFNNNNIIINKNKDLNMNIYGFLTYNRAISKPEMEGVRDYFITNTNKNYNNPDINNYHFDNSLDSSSFVKKNFMPSNTTKERYSNIHDTSFQSTFANQNERFTTLKDCANDCDSMCSKFLNNGSSNDTQAYKDCIKNCKNVLYSCSKYCEEEDNESSKYCTGDSSINNSNKCPIVYKKDGNYMVYVFPNSTYAEQLNYSGEKSYGTNQEKARYIYTQNFPSCPPPPQLMPGEGKNTLNSCPFTLHESNPCFVQNCAGVNWDVKDYKQLNMNDKCKNAVASYCKTNYDVDYNCFCWDPANKENPECIEYRNFFEDPNKYCFPKAFKIEDHPDFDKYIRKDNIPCWGCDLDKK